MDALLPETNCMTSLSELLPAFTLLPLIYAATSIYAHAL
jgi:hypothetical protein